MKLIRSVAVLALSLGTVPAAHAVALDGSTQTLCMTAGGLSSCASVQVVLGTGTLQATVKNLGGTGTYLLSTFGFFYTGFTAASNIVLIPSPQTSNGNTWEYNTNPAAALGMCDGLTEPGPVGGTWLGGACASGNLDRLTTNETIVLNFNVDGLTNTDSNIFFAFRGQDWNNGGSFKCYEGAGGTASTTVGDQKVDFAVTCAPPTVVPEPATMALLATGLVGLGGAGLIRRRRKS